MRRDVSDLPLVLPNQRSLFGEPPLRPELSQWFSPMPLARRLAHWVPKGVRVVEPACGSGNLIAALLELGHHHKMILGVDLDAEWVAYARARFEHRSSPGDGPLTGVQIVQGDFLKHASLYADHAEVVLMNPPFEDGAHSAFVAKALEISTTVIGIFPVTIEFGKDRDRDLWSRVAKVVRRARLPERVKYGGSFSASFETVALEIVRRDKPRSADEVLSVQEEVWT